LFGQENYRTLVHEGNQKFDGKDYDGASSKYMEAVKSKYKDFTAHYNMGNALYKSKKYEEAKAEFEKAEQLSQTLPDKAAALHNLGNTYMQMNQPEKAADYYKKSLKAKPYSEATRKNYEIAN
jgi:Tfp pilus assembly protein PilF